MSTAVSPAPSCCRDAEDLRLVLARTRLAHANLLAAARAAVAAQVAGESDPLWYLRDELTSDGPAPSGAWGPA